MKKAHHAIQFSIRWAKNFVDSCHNVRDIDRAKLIAAYCAVGYVLKPTASDRNRARKLRIDEVKDLLSRVNPFEMIRTFQADGIYDNCRPREKFPIMHKIFKLHEERGIGVEINKMLVEYLGMNIREFEGEIVKVSDESHQLATEQFAREEERNNVLKWGLHYGGGQASK